jgi:hypothetical protein
MAKVYTEGEFLPHRLLWLGAERFDVQRLAGSDSTFAAIAAMLFLHFAVESFINDLGERLRPEVCGDTRTPFRFGKFRGLLGKIRYLAGELGITLSEDERPLSTLRELHQRRHQLVHAKPHRFARVAEAPDPNNYHFPDPLLKLFEDRDFFIRARDDAKALCDQLVTAARRHVGPGIGTEAFFGNFSMATTWFSDEEWPPQASHSAR